MSAPGSNTFHEPVLARTVVEHLLPRPGTIVVDGTTGTGGHSLLIAPRLLPGGRLVAIDRDPASLGVARRRLVEFEPAVSFLHGDFRRLPELLQQLGLSRIDGLLLDLGMSSPQVDQPERGFSFLREGPLDMRMNPDEPTTAERLVNTLSRDELAHVIHTLGEERFARRIAGGIVEARAEEPITTTSQLVRLIVQAVPASARHGRMHAATRTFQALRMAVNDELGALEHVLGALPDLLAPGARAVVISFHSLEDRLVKHAFAGGARAGQWALLTKKPLTADDEEIARNPRARSAKLRAVERL